MSDMKTNLLENHSGTVYILQKGSDAQFYMKLRLSSFSFCFVRSDPDNHKGQCKVFMFGQNLAAQQPQSVDIQCGCCCC